ncbi:hypothetical protein QVD99_006156 [Batrachochytrium dendrobatidis]|nr:hypothetical protein QVD99_006156 [Batrachochytrium dendrobatidis]
MKLSIAVLSSILAVCSVTIANPVDPSSTMSAEASTPTASSSGVQPVDLILRISYTRRLAFKGLIQALESKRDSGVKLQAVGLILLNLILKRAVGSCKLKDEYDERKERAAA